MTKNNKNVIDEKEQEFHNYTVDEILAELQEGKSSLTKQIESKEQEIHNREISTLNEELIKTDSLSDSDATGTEDSIENDSDINEDLNTFFYENPDNSVDSKLDDSTDSKLETEFLLETNKITGSKIIDTPKKGNKLFESIKQSLKINKSNKKNEFKVDINVFDEDEEDKPAEEVFEETPVIEDLYEELSAIEKLSAIKEETPDNNKTDKTLNQGDLLRINKIEKEITSDKHFEKIFEEKLEAIDDTELEKQLSDTLDDLDLKDLDLDKKSDTNKTVKEIFKTDIVDESTLDESIKIEDSHKDEPDESIKIEKPHKDEPSDEQLKDLLAPDSKKNNPVLNYLKKIQKFITQAISFSDDDQNKIIEDFENYDDAPSIKNNLSVKLKNLSVSIITLSICCILSLLLTIINLFNFPFFAFSGNLVIFNSFQLVLLIIAFFVSHKTILNGLKSIIKPNSGTDTILALVSVITMIHTIILIFLSGTLSVEQSTVYVLVVLFALNLNFIGKFFLTKRIYNNFKFVSNEGEKRAVTIINDRDIKNDVQQISPYEEIKIASGIKTGFLTKFLALSYSADPAEKLAQILSPAVIACSLLASLASLIITGNFMDAFNTFVVLLCICIPVFSIINGNLLLLVANNKIKKNNSIISGYKAVDEFSDINSIILDAPEIFIPEDIVLYDIKTFEENRIDNAILDAASLVCMANWPLSGLFDRVILGKREILPKVDSFDDSSGNGIEGWIDGHRVLVGNRDLLRTFGITPPSIDYENRYILEGKQLIYLAASGQLTAMFVVGYNVTEEKYEQMRNLYKSGLNILINTTDPNVTSDLIESKFDFTPGSIIVLSPRGHKSYEKNNMKSLSSSDAYIGFSGGSAALANAIAWCVNLKHSIDFAATIQTVSMIIGFAFVMLLTLYQTPAAITALGILIFQLAFGSIGIFINLLKK